MHYLALVVVSTDVKHRDTDVKHQYSLPLYKLARFAHDSCDIHVRVFPDLVLINKTYGEHGI